VHEKRSAPSKNTVNRWKREESKPRERFEKEFAQGTSNKLRATEAKRAEMEEAWYVWFRHMQGRDMTLTADIIRSEAKQLGTQLGVLRKTVGVQHVCTVWLSGHIYDTGKARHVQQYTCHNQRSPPRQFYVLLACTACTNYLAS
jgi:hypothetical protein